MLRRQTAVVWLLQVIVTVDVNLSLCLCSVVRRLMKTVLTLREFVHVSLDLATCIADMMCYLARNRILLGVCWRDFYVVDCVRCGGCGLLGTITHNKYVCVGRSRRVYNSGLETVHVRAP